MNLIDTSGLGKCIALLHLAAQYGSNTTHCDPSSDTFFCDFGEKGFYLYTGPGHIINPGAGWSKADLVLIQNIRDAVLQCKNIQAFEDFVINNGGYVSKAENGEYRYATQLILEEWLRSPSLAVKKIKKLKSTKYRPQATA